MTRTRPLNVISLYCDRDVPSRREALVPSLAKYLQATLNSVAASLQVFTLHLSRLAEGLLSSLPLGKGMQFSAGLGIISWHFCRCLFAIIPTAGLATQKAGQVQINVCR